MSFLKKQSETLGQIHRLHVLTSVYMFEIEANVVVVSFNSFYGCNQSSRDLANYSVLQLFRLKVYSRFSEMIEKSPAVS